MSPVNLVNVEGVSLAYGADPVLDAVSLGVADGDRIGIVGRNGAGKSTLIRVLSRNETPDAGRVTHAGGLRIGLLDQGDTLDPAATVHAVVLGGRPELQHVPLGHQRELHGRNPASVGAPTRPNGR